MENIETKNSIPKAPMPVVVISIYLLLSGILTIISLFIGGISGIYSLAMFTGSLNTVALIIFGVASLFVSFRLRTMQKSGLYGTLILIIISLLPLLYIVSRYMIHYGQISGPSLSTFIFSPYVILKVVILVYLWIIRKKFI